MMMMMVIIIIIIIIGHLLADEPHRSRALFGPPPGLGRVSRIGANAENAQRRRRRWSACILWPFVRSFARLMNSQTRYEKWRMPMEGRGANVSHGEEARGGGGREGEGGDSLDWLN